MVDAPDSRKGVQDCSKSQGQYPPEIIKVFGKAFSRTLHETSPFLKKGGTQKLFFFIKDLCSDRSGTSGCHYVGRGRGHMGTCMRATLPRQGRAGATTGDVTPDAFPPKTGSVEMLRVIVFTRIFTGLNARIQTGYDLTHCF
ncbi:hypothetical protein [Novacetimonas hansenii]|uniref:hypothetical protein n=1 Tax=Novacetimonas hansenii TaxID=436 RepID=UPI000789BCC5|nr:hypothetical protein [Novacetimonas hansenii]RFP02889.1 hypothetical protein BGC30_05580 [Novacetimonas hansenii]WEQ58472.1 hypothetical protein LV563_11560 [Novacetimonas hansenii]